MQPHPSLYYDPAAGPYRALIGTGGVGSGSFFAIEGSHTLGREESRAGHFLPRRDYCKLHIIAHYVKRLLGDEFTVIPASKVGDDRRGRQLLDEIRDAGMLTDYLEISPDDATLFSFCFIYPDGTGGNLTTSDAATQSVSVPFIQRLTPEFERWSGAGIALAAPEVPLNARQALLELGGRYAFFRAAGLTSQEARSRDAAGIIANADLLALNLDEAAALGSETTDAPIHSVIESAQRAACHHNPNIYLSITTGRGGSWCWDGADWTHTRAYRVEAVGTAGAGDAHLAGMLAGLAAGLSLPLAQQLASLAAAFSVTSPHTIHPDLDRPALAQFAHVQAAVLDPRVSRLLGEAPLPRIEAAQP